MKHILYIICNLIKYKDVIVGFKYIIKSEIFTMYRQEYFLTYNMYVLKALTI